MIRMFLDDCRAYIGSLRLRAVWRTRGVHVAPGAGIRGHVEIGPGAIIGRDAVLVAGPNARIVVGAGAVINHRCFITAKRFIEIGANVLFANNVFVSDHGHELGDGSRAVVRLGATTPVPVRIGAGAFIGINVVVLAGSGIGNGAVIGANSVVTGEIPARAVAVGAPARVIRNRTIHMEQRSRHATQAV